MKFNVINLIFCLAACALFCTCSKDKLSPLEQLPPITSRGANTFGCLLNGEPIVFTNPKQISYGLISDYDSLGVLPYDSADMWLFFDNGVNTINLFLNNPLFKNTWSLNYSTFVHPVLVSPKDYLMVNGFMSSENTKGWFHSNDLMVTRPIFSGTFEFECINPKTCQSMKVTNGRLDVNLNQLQ
jgi:hypothetical protein